MISPGATNALQPNANKTSAANSVPETAPRAIQPLLSLATRLRQHGFAVSPEQTMGFIQAVGVLGPQHIKDIRLAAIALYAIPPERIAEFDALFKELFLGLNVAAAAKSSDDEVDAFEPSGGEQSVDAEETDVGTGTDAVTAERLQSREFSELADVTTLVNFERQAAQRLPQRQSYRWNTAKRGVKLDMRRTLRAATKHDGEVIDLKYLRRKKRQRRLLLLIDVSGSMKENSTSSMPFAHSLVRAADSAEVFTLGTRLTRITSALTLDDRNMALSRVSQQVSDFDGGTRIGEALRAFLAVPKYAGFARGAAVVVLSDGLERGNSDAMVEATQRLSRIAWRLSWLTPLAVDVEYQPETEALKRVLPFLHQLGSSHSMGAICDHVLNMARTA